MATTEQIAEALLTGDIDTILRLVLRHLGRISHTDDPFDPGDLQLLKTLFHVRGVRMDNEPDWTPTPKTGPIQMDPNTVEVLRKAQERLDSRTR